MHTLEMKKRSFIKNKVMEAIITRSVEKASLIPPTHVYQPMCSITLKVMELRAYGANTFPMSLMW
jgi:tRNA G10  N-methylase Trm11